MLTTFDLTAVEHKLWLSIVSRFEPVTTFADASNYALEVIQDQRKIEEHDRQVRQAQRDLERGVAETRLNEDSHIQQQLDAANRQIAELEEELNAKSFSTYSLELDDANRSKEAAEEKLGNLVQAISQRIDYWQPIIDRGETGQHEASHRVAELKFLKEQARSTTLGST